jgi:tRNA(Arg) A34 adenosine deaminase TadA
MSNPKPLLRQAIRLSVEMMRQGKGGPFGALIVREGQVIGRGWNQVTSTNDPTAHAEIVAIREACRETGSFLLPGCELYSSCEPCPMCLSAAYWARLQRVYYAARRSDAAEAGFLDKTIYKELARKPSERSLPCAGLLREEALAAFQEWKTKPDRVPY